MKNWIESLGTIWLVILSGLLVYSLFFKKPEDPAKQMIQYWEQRGFKTDTVHVEVDYHKLPKPAFTYNVPPAKVYTYPAPKDIEGVYIKLVDSLLTVVDSLRDEITTIHEDYLRVKPTAPKLIHGFFNQDSIQWDFLNIDGKFYTNSYGVDYNQFEYQWADGQMRANSITPKPTRHRINFSLYGYAGYDLYLQSPLIKAEYNLDYRRIRLQGAGSIPIQNLESTGMSLNLGYKIR